MYSDIRKKRKSVICSYYWIEGGEKMTSDTTVKIIGKAVAKLTITIGIWKLVSWVCGKLHK